MVSVMLPVFLPRQVELLVLRLLTDMASTKVTARVSGQFLAPLAEMTDTVAE